MKYLSFVEFNCYVTTLVLYVHLHSPVPSLVSMTKG